MTQTIPSQGARLSVIATASAVLNGLGALQARDVYFARDIAEKAMKGPISERQTYWLGVMADRIANGTPEPKKAEVGKDFSGVYELLQKAREHLKFPKIRLQTESGSPVALGLSGPKSKAPNTVNVTDGGPYGENRWYGRVETDGTWTQPRRQFEEMAEVETVLRALADDPAGTAAEYGRLTGHCCFCNRHLEDERSTDVGYGPVCAKNFGLPWGAKKEG